MAETTDTLPTDGQGQVEARASLGRQLRTKFDQYKKDRLPVEQQWMKNLRQYLGKYDPDVEAALPADTSRAYPKRTRVKVVSIVSRLMSLLFPAGEKNWALKASKVPDVSAEQLLIALENWQAANPGVAPTQEMLNRLMEDTARAAADKLEKVIDDQLQDIDPYGRSDYEALARKVVYSGVLYGPGIIKGPSVIAHRTAKYEITNGVVQVVEVDTYRPYFEFVPCWDYFPDLGAPTFAQMDCEFQRHVYSRAQLKALQAREDFDRDAIEKALARMPNGNYQKYNYETEMQAIGGQSNTPPSEISKYELVETWGTLPASKLRAAGVELPEGTDDEDELRFTAWLIDNQIIKLARNPLPMGTRVFHQFVFEDDEVNLMGSGLPPIMRDSQLAVSSFARMLIDNAASVCGPNVEVDVDLISPSQTDMRIMPFKVWKKEGGQIGQRAVQSVSFDSHISELLSAIGRFDEFADSETFVNSLTGGDVEGVPGEALRTTGGASMIYANAALPFKDIVRNFDQFTVSVIGALVEWNRLFHEDRAQLVGDVRPLARGATSLMAKEIRAFALQQLSMTLSDEDRMYLDSKAFLIERLRVHDLHTSELLAPDEVVQQRMEQRSQEADAAQQSQQAMLMAQLKMMDADTLKAMSQAQKNLDNADVAIMKTLLEALNNGASPEQLVAIAQRTRQGRGGQPGQ